MTMWTQTKRDDLRKLIEEDGLTASEAGTRMGITRNSVIGQCFRHGIRTQNGPDSGPEARERRRKARERLRAERDRPPPGKTIKPPKEQQIFGPFINVARLGSTTCRYPIGDPQILGFGFCGKPCSCEEPYCQTHRDLCHGAPPPRTGAPGVVRK